MDIITYFNFLVNIIFICYLIYKHNRLYIGVNKTFWYKKIISITLYWKTHVSEYGGYSAKGFLTIPLKNWRKATEWDSKKFEMENKQNKG